MNYELTEDQLHRLLSACEPVPMIALNTGDPATPQESANAAWVALGKEMGFDGMTVRPIFGKGPRHFTAEPA